MDYSKAKILIVDDHKNVLKALKHLLEFDFGEVFTNSNPNLIPELFRNNQYDVILLDMNFSANVCSGNEGFYWMHRILENDPDAVVVLITAYGDVELAVKAMKEGATDFILKPWNNEKLIATLQFACKLRQSKLEISNLKVKQSLLSEDIDKQYNIIIGNSSPMQKLQRVISKVATTDTSILITGENGTGKELIARDIHKKSLRSDEVFVSVDLGSITEGLFESEMFGSVKGAYTDSIENRTGRFVAASGGTIFLDEIGNLSISLQSKLLKVLQDLKITPLGTNTEIPIDVRLILATNKDLQSMIDLNLFRDDLYYRINTIEIKMPPLRERGEDIVSLAEFFLNKYKFKYAKPSLKLSVKAIDKLRKYEWPGNVRELDHSIEKSVIFAETNILSAGDFFFNDRVTQQDNVNKPMTFDEIEKQAINNALIRNRGSIDKASKEMGLSRQTLYNKINKYGL